MNITFSSQTNSELFKTIVRLVEHICEKHGTRNEHEVINLIQQEWGVRLIRDGRYDGGNATVTLWTAHFASEKAYVWFLLRWS